MSWKSKKEMVIDQFGVESEYRVVGRITCELIRLKRMLEELGWFKRNKWW